ncbi:MAG: DUF92 domain-containing protein [Anaerolinea sp.]|nr:DUF92 domain-containing protein [Anaerolinea sp.]
MTFFQSPAGQLILGALLAFIAAGGAYRFKLLTLSGALAAFVLGAVTFGLGGWSWALVLITFFISSSALSLFFKKRKRAAESMYSKGDRRDAAQVLANGGIASLFVILHLFLPYSWIAWVGFCAALAAANADTWATELGVLNPRMPILIVSGKHVEPGTSGAVSLVGTLASTAGAVLIALLAWIIKPAGWNGLSGFEMILLVTICGLAGSLVDSVLGATVQAIFYCDTCQKETEKHPLHDCGAETHLIRGKKWMDNDWVNLGCTLSGSVLVIVLGWLFQSL